MRTRSFAAGIALAAVLGSVSADAGPLLAATWTQNIGGVAITVTNSGASCTDTNPDRVPGAGFLICPSAGLQATGSTGADASYAVSLTMPLFQMELFTTGGPINWGTRARLSGAQVIEGGASAATVVQGAISGSLTSGGARHTMLSSWALREGGRSARSSRSPSASGRHGSSSAASRCSGPTPTSRSTSTPGHREP